jgi:hemerythrin superfamily protein
MALTLFEEIREDHTLIRALLHELVSNPDTRDFRYISLKRELAAHLHAEEATLYTRLDGVLPEEIRRSRKEHDELRERLTNLDAIPLDTGEWVTQMKELVKQTEEHFANEEDVIFHQAQDHLNRFELSELGDNFEKVKGEVLQSSSI